MMDENSPLSPKDIIINALGQRSSELSARLSSGHTNSQTFAARNLAGKKVIAAIAIGTLN